MNDQMQIDRSDIEVLLNALDNYEHDESGKMATALVGAMMQQTDKEAAREFVADEKRKAQAETASRRERCIMLKAKLLLWRDRMEATEFSDGALRPPKTE